jgi:hypothetical protein
MYDMEVLERRTREHHALQEHLVTWLSRDGWNVGLSPDPSIVVDVLAERDGEWMVFEVKTVDESDAALTRQQLRVGLGQVVEYRERLRPLHSNVHAAVVLSSSPADASWVEVMASCGVRLISPPFDQFKPPL